MTSVFWLAGLVFLPSVFAYSPSDSVLASTTAVGYGSAVAVGDGELFVAEPLNTSREGIVYVYRRSESGAWVEAAQLRASDATSGDRFGRSIAVSGDLLVVGATAADSGRGAAYVFGRDASGGWRQVARLTAPGAAPEDGLGRTVAVTDDFVFTAAAGHREEAGVVYVFRRGSWASPTPLVAHDALAGDLFGLGLAADGRRLAVTAFQHNNQVGAVYLFRQDGAGSWVEEGKLEVEGLPPGTHFGFDLALNGDEALIGAPGAEGNLGAAFVFRTQERSWVQVAKLVPTDSTPRQRFGSTIAVEGAEAWIGAPYAGGSGTIYRFNRTASGVWKSAGELTGGEAEQGDQYAGAVARRGAVAAVGLPGDDYGEGTAIVLEREARTGEWRSKGKIFSEVAGLDPILGGQRLCEGGRVAGFECGEVDVVSFLPREALGAKRGVRLNDVWGWTDPETGREYAIAGRLDAAVFVDVTDAANPVYLGELPKTAGSPGSVWRDIKVYQNHAFIVADGAGAHGMQVFDLTRLRKVRNPPVTFTETVHYEQIHSAHNIVINEATGYAYAVGSSSGGETCGGGLHMINIQVPTRPTFAGCFSDPNTGRRKTGYSHDAQCVTYQGPDTEHRDREICFGANETALSIADVTDKDRPVSLSMASYPNVAYTHQGWLTEDHRYFYTNDEGDELSGLVPNTRTLVWDVTDLDDPILVKEHFATFSSTDHNLYVHGNFMYQANNTAGLRILDVSDPEAPVEVAFFDPVPHGANEPGFDGTWSSYPFFESGLIVVTSRREGLFLLKKRDQKVIP